MAKRGSKPTVKAGAKVSRTKIPKMGNTRTLSGGKIRVFKKKKKLDKKGRVTHWSVGVKIKKKKKYPYMKGSKNC